MRPSNNIGFLLQRLAFLLTRLNDQILQEQLGLGFSQFKILMILRWRPSTSQKLIANKLGQTEASVSRQIKLLEEEGMLNVQINPNNRREHITRLTPKGLRIIEKALEILNNYHTPMFEELTDKQKQQLTEALTIMHNFVCRTEKPGTEYVFEV